jgi:hypothetical protein
MPATDDRAVIKVTRNAYDRVRELSALVAQHGWACVGVKREDLPTMSAILEEAINAFAERAKAGREKKR